MPTEALVERGPSSDAGRLGGSLASDDRAVPLVGLGDCAHRDRARLRRPDLLVLAVPLMVISVWSVMTRPRRSPSVSDRLGHATVREGEATTWQIEAAQLDHVDVVSAITTDVHWFERSPQRGSVSADVSDVGGPDDVVPLSLKVRALRWGRYAFDPLLISSASSWGGFRHLVTLPAKTITALPQPVVFDSAAPVRPSDGLVGSHRSVRPGEGSEFAGVRAFQVGDRMRRINWTRSLRSDGLQVNATFADQDTHVALVIDSGFDLGVSGGVDGVASSLDTSVRAAGAIAEHFGTRGNRVSLRSLDHTARLRVPPGSGAAHVRRILDTLARVNAPGGRFAVWGSQRSDGSAAMTVVLSPLLTQDALDRAVRLGRTGRPVVVIDTLPEAVAEHDDPITNLAWRIRLLERRRELRLVQELGVAVVRWQGPGSIDEFLRDAVRRTAAPRIRA